MEQPARMILGIPAEQYPLKCQSCPRLAAFALRHSTVDLSTRTFYPLPQNRADHLARLLFFAMGAECLKNTTDDCGLKPKG
ncbi:MAG: hypothetical protein V4678_02410 [Patescibacteria group bacterium]